MRNKIRHHRRESSCASGTHVSELGFFFDKHAQIIDHLPALCYGLVRPSSRLIDESNRVLIEHPSSIMRTQAKPFHDPKTEKSKVRKSPK